MIFAEVAARLSESDLVIEMPSEDRILLEDPPNLLPLVEPLQSLASAIPQGTEIRLVDVDGAHEPIPDLLPRFSTALQ
jgi:hypothetical protein